MKKIVAFVHAKDNSMRVPNKNIRILGNKPLFCHAIHNVLKSKLVTEVIIDSDSDEILSIGRQLGATPLKRPIELANNNTTGDDLAYWQANNYPNSTIMLQVPPTSPFLLPSSINKAIMMIYEQNIDSVAGVFHNIFYEWIDNKPAYFIDGKIPNSFDIKPIVYETMGLCAVKTKFVLSARKRLNINSCLPCLLSKIESIDINTIEDFEFAEIIWKGLQTFEK